MHLTKSRYVNGLACSKWLWLALNAPEGLPKIDESAQYRLAEGRRVGELARRRYPTGMVLPTESQDENDRRSKKLLLKRAPLFEAGLAHPDGACYARADILLPAGEDEWNVVEVKSGGGVKEEYLYDLAFQQYCYTGAGLRVRRCTLLLVNTRYERSGEIDPLRLFREEDVTAGVKGLAPEVQPNVKALLKIAHSKECPEFGRGEQFHEDKFGIHSDDTIWTEHPTSDIRDLYGGGKRILGLLGAGVFSIREIPKDVVLSWRQGIQRATITSGRAHVDREKIATFLGQLNFPLHFLDFETIYPAIPLFDGTRPYQQIPFQFSVHVVEAPGQQPRHHSFHSLEPTDPRGVLLESLQKAIGPEGHLVAYNQSFERNRLEELAESFPEHAEWVREAKGRFIDLMTPFKNFAYYSATQGGSTSLKAVLPAVTGRGYDEFAIANCSQASAAFLHAAFGTGDGSKASAQEVREIRKALERYCGQDTEGIVWITEELAELAKDSTS